MNQAQINRKLMYETTLAFMDEHAAKWQSIAKIGEVKIELNDTVVQINQLAKQQADAANIYGKTKAGLKRIIANKADILNDLVEVFALMEGDNELANSMSDSASDLYKMKNEHFELRVKLIIEKAQEHAEVLTASYGMTDTQLTDLQADFDEYLEISGLPRVYQVRSTMTTKGLEELFSAASALLENKLDNLMKVFKRSDPALYNGYEKARMVVDY